MQFAPTVGPCGGRCGKNIRYSRKPGALGLCSACRTDEAKVKAARELRDGLKAAMEADLKEYGTWDPKVGAYRMDMNRMFKDMKARR